MARSNISPGSKKKTKQSNTSPQLNTNSHNRKSTQQNSVNDNGLVERIYDESTMNNNQVMSNPTVDALNKRECDAIERPLHAIEMHSMEEQSGNEENLKLSQNNMKQNVGENTKPQQINKLTSNDEFKEVDHTTESEVLLNDEEKFKQGNMDCAEQKNITNCCDECIEKLNQTFLNDEEKAREIEKDEITTNKQDLSTSSALAQKQKDTDGREEFSCDNLNNEKYNEIKYRSGFSSDIRTSGISFANPVSSSFNEKADNVCNTSSNTYDCYSNNCNQYGNSCQGSYEHEHYSNQCTKEVNRPSCSYHDDSCQNSCLNHSYNCAELHRCSKSATPILCNCKPSSNPRFHQQPQSCNSRSIHTPANFKLSQSLLNDSSNTVKTSQNNDANNNSETHYYAYNVSNNESENMQNKFSHSWNSTNENIDDDDNNKNNERNNDDTRLSALSNNCLWKDSYRQERCTKVVTCESDDFSTNENNNTFSENSCQSEKSTCSSSSCISKQEISTSPVGQLHSLFDACYPNRHSLFLQRNCSTPGSPRSLKHRFSYPRHPQSARNFQHHYQHQNRHLHHHQLLRLSKLHRHPVSSTQINNHGYTMIQSNIANRNSVDKAGHNFGTSNSKLCIDKSKCDRESNVNNEYDSSSTASPSIHVTLFRGLRNAVPYTETNCHPHSSEKKEPMTQIKNFEKSSKLPQYLNSSSSYINSVVCMKEPPLPRHSFSNQLKTSNGLRGLVSLTEDTEFSSKSSTPITDVSSCLNGDFESDDRISVQSLQKLLNHSNYALSKRLHERKELLTVVSEQQNMLNKRNLELALLKQELDKKKITELVDSGHLGSYEYNESTKNKLSQESDKNKSPALEPLWSNSMTKNNNNLCNQQYMDERRLVSSVCNDATFSKTSLGEPIVANIVSKQMNSPAAHSDYCTDPLHSASYNNNNINECSNLEGIEIDKEGEHEDSTHQVEKYVIDEYSRANTHQMRQSPEQQRLNFHLLHPTLAAVAYMNSDQSLMPRPAIPTDVTARTVLAFNKDPTLLHPGECSSSCLSSPDYMDYTSSVGDLETILPQICAKVNCPPHQTKRSSSTRNASPPSLDLSNIEVTLSNTSAFLTSIANEASIDDKAEIDKNICQLHESSYGQLYWKTQALAWKNLSIRLLLRLTKSAPECLTLEDLSMTAIIDKKAMDEPKEIAEHEINENDEKKLKDHIFMRVREIVQHAVDCDTSHSQVHSSSSVKSSSETQKSLLDIVNKLDNDKDNNNNNNNNTFSASKLANKNNAVCEFKCLSKLNLTPKHASVHSSDYTIAGDNNSLQVDTQDSVPDNLTNTTKNGYIRLEDKENNTQKAKLKIQQVKRLLKKPWKSLKINKT